MDHYLYQCTSCSRQFGREKIEEQRHYLCPDCGSARENQPLTGVLNLVYDYPEIKKQISREKILQFTPGQPWLYPQLWPLDFLQAGGFSSINPEMLSRLTLPAGMVSRVRINTREMLVMDETRNPTLSFKDRASILVALKALQMGISEISVASTGNAGSSMAGICARLGMRSHIWVPENIPTAHLLQIIAYGAQLHLVRGSYDMAFDLSLKVASEQGWYNRNTAFNPLTIEGKKSAAFDLFIDRQGNLPAVIIVPVGDGVILAGMYKGFRELADLGWIENMPRLIAVQASGSDALVRYLLQDKFEFIEPRTQADSISAGAPRNLYMAAQAVHETNGLALAVTDSDMYNAQQDIARDTGILPEPSAAAVLAGYESLLAQEMLDPQDEVLLLMTGNGLKDINALERVVKIPEASFTTGMAESLLS